MTAQLNNKKLKISELDFDTIKGNLKSFLQGQSQFADYDFEGSGLSILLDILAYNTHYQSMYLNMLANEMFLDSAVKRSSIVSIAKHLGYTPSSELAATAYVDVILSSLTPSTQYTFPKNTLFTTEIEGTRYNFYTQDSLVETSNAAGVLTLTDVEIKEGTPLAEQFLVDTRNSNQRFILQTNQADVTTLVVTVQEGIFNNSLETFKLYSDLEELTPTDAVYFLNETDNGYFEITFGDGILGKNLVDGNIIIASYLKTNGAAANKAYEFESQDFEGSISIVTKQAAFGGMGIETNAEIKFKAPRNFAAQNRAVSIVDYKTKLLKDYPSMEAVAVWGGEDQTPPEYGSVLISIKPSEGLFLTETLKTKIIENVYANYGVSTVKVKIIDPEYINILINSTVQYDGNKALYSKNIIKANILNAIATFNTNQLSLFENKFYYSAFVNVIDTVDNSIKSNLTDIRLRKSVILSSIFAQGYSVNFGNAIKRNSSGTIGTISSSTFGYGGKQVYYEDDNNGVISLVNVTGGVKTIVNAIAGNVNYDTGLITVAPIKVDDSYGESTLYFTCTPKNNNVIPQKNQILLIDNVDVNIVMINDPSN